MNARLNCCRLYDDRCDVESTTEIDREAPAFWSPLSDTLSLHIHIFELPEHTHTYDASSDEYDTQIVFNVQCEGTMTRQSFHKNCLN